MTFIAEWLRGEATPASPRGLGVVLSTLAASLLFVLAYPPWNFGTVTAWLTLVPLIAVAARMTPGRAMLLGWWFGLMANLGIFYWVTYVPGIRWHHVALLDSYLSLYPAFWTLLVALFLRDSVLSQWFLTCAWVLLEYLRSHAGFLTFPWMTLAQSQVENTALLQTASLFGEGAVSGLVVLGNLAVWNLIHGRRRLAACCAFPLVVGAVMGAHVALESRAESVPTMRVAALGTAFPALIAARPDPLVRLESQLDFLQQYTPNSAALVVLPESAIVNPQLFPEQVGRLHRVAAERQLSLVTGVAEATKFDHPSVPLGPDKPQVRSEAWILTATDKDPQRYVKSQLVPFAESRPLKGWMSWPEWFIPSKPEVVRGPAPRSFPLADGVRVGIMICWESLFADHARALVDDGAAVLLVLANEGWFGGSAAGAQHNLTARMRAAETRRSVLIASNMGPALVIDPYGRLLADKPPGAGMQWATATAPLGTELSFYSRVGDVFVLVCALLTLTVLLKVWLERNSRLAHTLGALRGRYPYERATHSNPRRII